MLKKLGLGCLIGEKAPKWVEHKAFWMPDIKLKKQTATTTKQDL